MSILVVAPSGGVALLDEVELVTPFGLELGGVKPDVDVLPFLFLNIANRSQRWQTCPKVWVFYRRRVGPEFPMEPGCGMRRPVLTAQV